jgi:biopolymer transport protein TolR
MAMLVGGHGPSKAEINITPMIDILLVLIIIFMVVLPTGSEGLKAVAPQPAPDGTKSSVEYPLVITVLGNAMVQLNQELPLPLDSLDARLRDLFKTAARHTIFVRGERGLDYQQVAEVIDIARGAGIETIALMTQ